MEVKPVKKYSRKTKVYAGIILVFIACVVIRIGLVQRDRGRTIVSFVSEWAQKGKPVTVEKIIARDIPVYTKLSVQGVAGSRAVGYVTRDIYEKLLEGQEVLCADKITPCGSIVTIGNELDADTGMYSVEIERGVALGAGELAVVFVRTHTLPDALVVPNDILDSSGKEFYLWKVENARAKRIRVTIGSRNGYGTALSEGIKSGDVIVFNGRSSLVEGDKVSITEGAL